MHKHDDNIEYYKHWVFNIQKNKQFESTSEKRRCWTHNSYAKMLLKKYVLNSGLHRVCEYMYTDKKVVLEKTLNLPKVKWSGI